MSSKGRISNPIIPQTSIGEDIRQQSEDNISVSSLGPKVFFGLITDIHPSENLIKASTFGGTSIGDGSWIPLTHTIDEVIERFGKLRKGMRVKIDSGGIASGQFIASIVGLESDTVSKDTQLINEIEKSLYAIFTPGF